MKRILLSLALVGLFAGNVFAAAATGIPTGVKGFTKSNNSEVAYESAGSPADRYAISAKHAQGNKIYGTVSGSATIYHAEGTSGTALVADNNPDAPGSATDTTVTGGIGSWTAM